MKQLNSKKTRFPPFDKILVIQPIADVYGEGKERQLCWEIDVGVSGAATSLLRQVTKLRVSLRQ